MYIEYSKIFHAGLKDSKVTIAEAAKKMGVSRNTIYDWLNGVSRPRLEDAFDWFEALNLNPFRYFLDYKYPDLFDGLTAADEDIKVKEALLTAIADSHPGEQRILLYILAAKHGSPPWMLLELFCAFSHLDLRSQATIAGSIIAAYEIALETNSLVCPDHIKPNLAFLKICQKRQLEAVFENKNAFSILDTDGK